MPLERRGQQIGTGDESHPVAEAEKTEKTEAVAEVEAVVKAEKPKRSRKKEPVAVA